MNQSFYRKIAYLLVLVALLWPMSWLGAPSTATDPLGGKLSQLRSEAKLGQSDLGAIDPASETIRMATLGLRGMAVTMLWNKANEYKKVEDWANFRATLEQLARLQPYFVKVWQYQAWNLTYNVSVELDDYRDRFYYVKQGIQYLREGIDYLRDNPTLLDDLGWFHGNKVGRADEHEQYRAMYKQDEDLHDADTPAADRDNWLASRKWYELAMSAVDDRNQPLGTKNPVTFYDSAARSQMSFAEAIQEEGILASRWESAWREGGRLWAEYGKRLMPSTDGFLIALGDQEKHDNDIKTALAKLDNLSPGLMEKMRADAQAKLTDRQKELLKALPEGASEEDNKLYADATASLEITPQKVASEIARQNPDLAVQARTLATAIDDANARSRAISIDRDVANFEYWRLRCAIEQSPQALKARELALDAHRAFQNEGDLTRARSLYEQSFDLWAQALKNFPEMSPDSTFGSDLMEFVDAYDQVLEQLDLNLSDEGVDERFALWDVVIANNPELRYTDDLEKREARKTGIPPGTKPAINLADALVF